MPPLPIELERYILLFIVYSDDKETLISFASVSTRFRALALPFMFEALPLLSLNRKVLMGKRPYSPLLRACQSSDPHALTLARHIRRAALASTDRFNVSDWPESIREASANKYMLSLISLPHLVSLTLSNVLFDPNLLGRLLSSSLKSLTIKASRPDATMRKMLRETACIIHSHGHGLTQLDVQGHSLVHTLLSSKPESSSLPSLTHFAIRHTSIHTPDLVSFLNRTSGIRRLELDVDTFLPAPHPLPPDALPHLSHLTCPESWFESFLDPDASRLVISCTTVDSSGPRPVYVYEDDWFGTGSRKSAPLTYAEALKRMGTTRIKTMDVSLTMGLMDWSCTTPELEAFTVHIPMFDQTELFNLAQSSIPKLGQGTGMQPRSWLSVSDFELAWDLYQRRDLYSGCTMSMLAAPKKRAWLPDDGIGLDLTRQEALLPLVLGPFPNVTRVRLSPHVLWTRCRRDHTWTPSATV